MVVVLFALDGHFVASPTTTTTKRRRRRRRRHQVVSRITLSLSLYFQTQSHKNKTLPFSFLDYKIFAEVLFHFNKIFKSRIAYHSFIGKNTHFPPLKKHEPSRMFTNELWTFNEKKKEILNLKTKISPLSLSLIFQRYLSKKKRVN